MNSRDILRDAAEYIAEHGHCKGSYELTPSRSLWSQYEVGSVCAIGAIRKVTSGDAFTLDVKATEGAEEMLFKFVQHRNQAPFHGWESVSHWNDDEDTTAEHVILAMKRAAES